MGMYLDGMVLKRLERSIYEEGYIITKQVLTTGWYHGTM